MSRNTCPPESGRDRERRQLASWLLERQVDAAVTSTRHADDKPARAFGAGTPPESLRAPPAPGDVLLLPPSPVPADIERPVYVLVLDVAGDGAVQCVPFGRYASPATPGELDTSLRACPLRVLCLWNARTLAAGLVAAAWPSGRVAMRVLARARAMRAARASGQPLPASVAASVGPPLLHPADPRHLYLAEECELMERAALWLARHSRAPAGAPPARLVYPVREEVLPKAAEPRASYAPARRRKPPRN